MIKYIPNLVPPSLANNLDFSLCHDDTAWNLAVSCGGWADMNFIDMSHVKDTHQMYHSLVADDVHKSSLTAIALSVLFFLEDKTGIFPKYIARVKANLLFPMFDNPEQYHPPHIDTSSSTALSMVYYVNHSDGPTRFFDNSGNIIETIHPEKGSAVLFSSNIPHASSCPINSSKRIVLNFVFEPA